MSTYSKDMNKTGENKHNSEEMNKTGDYKHTRIECELQVVRKYNSVQSQIMMKQLRSNRNRHKIEHA